MSSATSGARSPFLGLTWSNISLTLFVLVLFVFGVEEEGKAREKRGKYENHEVEAEEKKRKKKWLLRDCLERVKKKALESALCSSSSSRRRRQLPLLFFLFSSQTYVSLNDLSVFLCRFDTAMRAASCENACLCVSKRERE